MELVFTNSAGSIRMDGGRGGAPYRIRAAEGLGYINRVAVTAQYPLRAGQKTLSRTAAARVITVSFDESEAGRRSEGFLAAVAHDAGRLTINAGGRSVYADCYISAFSSAAVYGGDYGRYTAQFTCDYPYFRDAAPTLRPLFERRELLGRNFVLPTVFSERTVGSDIKVSGDLDVYPSITLGGIAYGEDFVLSLANISTGAELKLKLPAGEYPPIRLDLRTGTVSCGGEDFTKYLDDDSYMSDFYLRRGENSVKITAAGLEAGASASVSFENEYISAFGDWTGEL